MRIKIKKIELILLAASCEEPIRLRRRARQSQSSIPLRNVLIFLLAFSVASSRECARRDSRNFLTTKIFYFIILTLFITAMWNHGSGQYMAAQGDQEPVVAGRFYPSDPVELKTMLKDFFAHAEAPVKTGEIRALIAPHAGYVYSGQVAASAYNQLDPGKEFKRVFLIGSSHHLLFDGAAVYNTGNFITPLGVVKVDTELADKLIHENSCMVSRRDAFSHEHSLEVQIPFLQYHLKKEFKLIPIVIAAQSSSMSRKIAQALQPYFTPENLFIISTDFSHYPDYQDAVLADHETAESILTGSPEKFIRTIQNNNEKSIPGLSTSACAWPSVLALMYLTSKEGSLAYHRIQYKNSGDQPFGDKDRVVGYCAIAVTKQVEQEEIFFSLGTADQQVLLGLARKSISFYLKNGSLPLVNEQELSEELKRPSGAFVTLKKNGNLRGCIGRMSSDEPLYKVVMDMAVSAATRDYRFEKVNFNELQEIEIEISVLSPMRKVASADEVVVGKHGIYIRKGSSSGTFLPQVGVETGWSREEFLGHCAKDKAGIGWDGWKEAEIFTYEAFVFHENKPER